MSNSLMNTDPAAFKRYMAAKYPSASKPTYEHLLAQLEKISNCVTRANSQDSTGAAMVQMRAALIEQTRELIAAAKQPTDEQFSAALGPCGK